MRKITQQITDAFLLGHARKIGNTETDGQSIWLYGNKIAQKRMCGQTEDSLYISSAGWKTNTTKERLNSLPGVEIVQKDFVWYLNGKSWDGQWTKIA